MNAQWQSPCLNIFKTYKVLSLKESSAFHLKGDTRVSSDNLIKSQKIDITGNIPAQAYLQLPSDAAKDSLNLIGRYFYLNFKPSPNAYFVVHLDLQIANSSITVRLSFSNLFKQFKTSPTWLQIPFLIDSSPGTPDGTADCKIPEGVRSPDKTPWIMFCLDLKKTMAVHLNKKYGGLKAIRICANLSVKSVFTSDIEFNPTLSPTEARKQGFKSNSEAFSPMPREMNFFVQKDQNWDDFYHYIRFPNHKISGPYNVIRRGGMKVVDYFEKENIAPETNISSANTEALSQLKLSKSKQPRKKVPPCHVAELPAIQTENTNKFLATGYEQAETHVFFDNQKTKFSDDELSLAPENQLPKSDFNPEMNITSVFGFANFQKSVNSNQVAINSNSDFYYSAENCIVQMHQNTQKNILLGHSEPVAALTICHSTQILISAQANQGESYSILRAWNIENDAVNCISMVRIPHTDITCLQTSRSGNILAGIGKLKSGVQYFLVWDISGLKKSGDISILAKATIHSSYGVLNGMIVLSDTKILTYGSYTFSDQGQGSAVRVWELKSGSITARNFDILAEPSNCQPDGRDNLRNQYSSTGVNITGGDYDDGMVYVRLVYEIFGGPLSIPMVSEYYTNFNGLKFAKKIVRVVQDFPVAYLGSMCFDRSHPFLYVISIPFFPFFIRFLIDF